MNTQYLIQQEYLLYYKKQEDYRTCTVDELRARLIFVL